MRDFHTGLHKKPVPVFVHLVNDPVVTAKRKIPAQRKTIKMWQSLTCGQGGWIIDPAPLPQK